MSTAVSDHVENLSAMHLSILDRMRGNKEFAQEIIGTFLEDISNRGMMIKNALDNKDTQTISIQADIIKNFSGNVGAVNLKDVACRIKAAGEAGDFIKVSMLAPMIFEYCQIIKKHWGSQNVQNAVSFYDNFECRR